MNDDVAAQSVAASRQRVRRQAGLHVYPALEPQPPVGPRRLKSILGKVIFGSGLARRLLGDQGVIVVFHRLCEEGEQDPIGISATQFEQYLQFFSRYFQVIPLGTMVDLVRSGKSVTGKLSITFDDGYLDNATIAAPLLEKYGHTACFFVATGFISTERVAPWDAARGVTYEWMRWQDVKRLRDRGHEIGSHTMNHPDLGAIAPGEAQIEVGTARKRLSDFLGEDVDLFAYPFGGHANISEDNRDVVTALGVRCILSAAGGCVQTGSNVFRMGRIPITDWFVTPYQFGFELVTGRL